MSITLANQTNQAEQPLDLRKPAPMLASPDAPSHRSCMALGVCQSRKPACAGYTVNAYNFAPGVIDFGKRLDSWQWRLARFIWALMGWMLVSGSITFAVVLVASYKGWL